LKDDKGTGSDKAGDSEDDAKELECDSGGMQSQPKYCTKEMIENIKNIPGCMEDSACKGKNSCCLSNCYIIGDACNNIVWDICSGQKHPISGETYPKPTKAYTGMKSIGNDGVITCSDPLTTAKLQASPSTAVEPEPCCSEPGGCPTQAPPTTTKPAHCG